MAHFSAHETAEIDRIWRMLPCDHVWSGWAMIDEEPEKVWLYRLRQNWRRFELIKEADAYLLMDEKGGQVGASKSLLDVLCDIEVAAPLFPA